MNLGETIYQLRTTQNMSQGELADRLNLSRQSVSKWENNSAVPDLDNLIKLSEIFGVSLDTLVKGNSTQTDNTITAADAAPSASSLQSLSIQKIAGLLLLCMSFISFLLITISTNLLSGLIIGAPFLVFGIICLVCKKHTGLFCAWTGYVCFDLFLRMSSGAGWSAVFAFSRYAENDLLPFFIIAWILFLSLISLLIVTIRTCTKEKCSVEKKLKSKTFVLWGLFAVSFVACILFNSNTAYTFLLDGHRNLWHFLCSLLDYCRIFLFTVALAQTLQYRNAKKCQ